MAAQGTRHTSSSLVNATASSTTATGSSTAKPGGPGPSAAKPPAATSFSVYAAAGANALSPVARTARPMVYVPNTLNDSVQLIDPRTYRVVGRFRTPREPQHVVPSWDLKTLWVNEDKGNALTPINPVTGAPGRPVHVDDPYNLYFTPDGKHALVMAERLHRIDVRDAHTMKLLRSLPVPCAGINHADFSADLTLLVASCEFSGKLVVLDAAATKVRKVIDLNTAKTPGATSPHDAMAMPGSPKNGLRPGASSMPQDVRLSPDGRDFLVADMLRNGVWVVDAHTLVVARFIHTGLGAHGLYPSRDGRQVYVANRDAGTITVLDATTLAAAALWRIPGGGSPDMGGVTADGSQLWLAGRYDAVVYVFDTATGRLVHKIAVDSGPHGLCVWPQPGLFSLGHTGNMR
ncbi:YncE family protein [Pedococcus bigeumensis]|uniref:YncE family protein n=1 Tax=Pedococcus bigeumensis TaxID=433644 RepID=A0A502D2V5_9MICO|nr:YncE family protein [Pedococcus bigeumensis]